MHSNALLINMSDKVLSPVKMGLNTKDAIKDVTAEAPQFLYQVAKATYPKNIEN
jgi:hypothetical protein